MLLRGLRQDTEFVLALIRKLKSFKPHYILANPSYDAEEIKNCINEEIKAFDQIPLKTYAKTGHNRRIV